MSWYTPTPELTEPDRERGLKFMYYDGIYSHAMALLPLYPFTTMPERYELTIPLLVLIHIIGGIIGSYFAIKEVSINLCYHADSANPESVISIPAMSFQGIDFIFLVAAPPTDGA